MSDHHEFSISENDGVVQFYFRGMRNFWRAGVWPELNWLDAV
ncbi:hypothetical protein ACFPRE_18575 [Variovorax soli]